jgi:uncharacterized protein YjbI with pentapeptide repeats
MKKIILITMLISAIFAQSDCNESNWQECYNSQGRDMSDCQLQGAMLRGARLMGADLTGADLTGANFTQARLMGADLTGADLTGAKLVGVISGDIRGVPDNLPEGWSLVDGTLIKV